MLNAHCATRKSSGPYDTDLEIEVQSVTGVVRPGVAGTGGWCSRRPRACRAPYPARAGGPWLCRTFVLFLFHVVVVPSGLTARVQPHRWMTI